MSYFKPLNEGDTAVLVDRGVFRQVPLFTNKGHLFAKVGAGFVRLSVDGATSKPNLRIEALVYSYPLYRDVARRLCAYDVDGRCKPLTEAEQAKLRGAE